MKKHFSHTSSKVSGWCKETSGNRRYSAPGRDILKKAVRAFFLRLQSTLSVLPAPMCALERTSLASSLGCPRLHSTFYAPRWASMTSKTPCGRVKTFFYTILINTELVDYRAVQLTIK